MANGLCAREGKSPTPAVNTETRIKPTQTPGSPPRGRQGVRPSVLLPRRGCEIQVDLGPDLPGSVTQSRGLSYENGSRSHKRVSWGAVQPCL